MLVFLLHAACSWSCAGVWLVGVCHYGFLHGLWAGGRVRGVYLCVQCGTFTVSLVCRVEGECGHRFIG